jgi:hypothetical protein
MARGLKKMLKWSLQGEKWWKNENRSVDCLKCSPCTGKKGIAHSTEPSADNFSKVAAGFRSAHGLSLSPLVQAEPEAARDHFFLATTSCLRVLAFGEPGPTLFVGRTMTSAPGNPGIPPRTSSRLFSVSILTIGKFRMVTRSLP